MLDDRLKLLKSFIFSQKEQILDEWVSWIQKEPNYGALGKRELTPSVEEALDGYIELICDNKPQRLDTFIDLIAEKRLALGFPLHAVMHAFEGFRRVITPALLGSDNQEELIGLLPEIFDASYYVGNKFAMRYQALSSKKQEAYMQELEETVRHMKIEIDGAERASMLKDNFLSNISHELRSPLTVILGFSKLMLNDTAPPEKMKELAGLIHRSGSTLLRLVNEIIMMAKLESGEEKIQSHHIYLNDLLSDAASGAKKELNDNSRQWDFDSCEPEPVLIGDFNKLQTLFFNLFANAVKFSPENSRIAVRSHIDNFDAFIDVVDEGIGIAAEEMDSVFEKFRQMEGDTGRKYSGTGLGLSLAQMIAIYHGGNITLKANPERKGSVFTVRLPLSKEWMRKINPAGQ